MFTSKALLTIIILILALPLYAYLDPGTGSAIISVVIAAIVSAGVVIKYYWRKIVSFVFKKKPENEDND